MARPQPVYQKLVLPKALLAQCVRALARENLLRAEKGLAPTTLGDYCRTRLAAMVSMELSSMSEPESKSNAA